MNEPSATSDTLYFGDPKEAESPPEFGECYHAAAFLAASSAHRIKIVSRWNNDDWRLTEEFLNKVSPGSTEIVGKEPKGAEDMGKSANYFSSNHSEGLPQKVEKKLKPLLKDKDRIAQVEKHLKPFESNLPSCLLWVRHGKYKPERNLTGLALEQLKSILMEAGVRPILIGAKPLYEVCDEPNLIEFHTDDLYEHNPLMQLVLLNQLCEKAGVKFSIGMKSGAMDGLGFARHLPTHYITNLSTNGRMDKVESAFPAFKKLLVGYDRKFMAFSPHEMERLFAAISCDLTPE